MSQDGNNDISSNITDDNNSSRVDISSNNKSNNKDSNLPKRQPKAVALLSGGLDSSLAVRMMLERGVDVEAVAIKTPFCDFDCGKGCGHRVKEVADELGVRLKTVYFGEEYLRMLKSPKHGYGSGMNPCIDCRAMMYQAAKDHMERTGADFVVTGEVLFQRPMSQNNRALQIIENETGMAGRVLRPLSAKHLPPTEAEKAGLISRESLGDIKGRSRKGQLALAKHFGVADPPNAAGGCLLTDPAFSKRLKDAMEHAGGQDGERSGIPSLNDVELLKVGRHFRLTPGAKLVVGRNRDENDVIRALAVEGDILLEAKDHVGPTCLLRRSGRGGKKAGANEEKDFGGESLMELCAGITLRYSDAPKEPGAKSKVVVKKIGPQGEDLEITAEPTESHRIDAMRI